MKIKEKEVVQETNEVEIPEDKILEIAEIQADVDATESFGQKVKQVFSKENLKKGAKTVGLLAVGGVLGVAALLLGTREHEDEPVDVDYVELDDVSEEPDSDVVIQEF